MKAIWNDRVIAESDDTVVAEGNHYIPPDAVKQEYLQPSDTHTTCPFKWLLAPYSISSKRLNGGKCLSIFGPLHLKISI